MSPAICRSGPFGSRPATRRPVAGRVAWFRWLALTFALLAVSLRGADMPQIDVPAGDAGRTLRLFARQTGVQLVYPVREIRGVRTNPVRGEMAPREALEVILHGTVLEAVEDPATGALVVRRAVMGTAQAGAAPERSAGPDAARDDPVVVLSPFEVRTQSDRGYRPANSVSATRIAAPISRLPMGISAFTEAFIADQKPYDLFDVVRWTPGVHQDNQSPQGWARYAVRGFTSASIQRNGFGSFRFIDTTNIARVEVVKGPSSLLYGQINPGGVINYITKRPEPRSRIELSAGAGTRGYTQVMADVNGPLDGAGGDVLGRLVGMTGEIHRFQEGSRGRKHLLAPSLRWQIGDRVSLVAEYERFSRIEDMLTGGIVLAYENGVAARPYPGLARDFSYAGRGDYQDFDSRVVTLELEADIGAGLHARATYLDSGWEMEWRATGQGATGLISQQAIDAYYPAEAGLKPRDAMFRRNRWERQAGGERALQLDVTGTYRLGDVLVRPLVGAKRVFSTPERNIQRNNPTIPGNPLYLRPWDLRDPGTWDRRVPFGAEALTTVADNSYSRSAASLCGALSLSALDDRLNVLTGYAFHQLENSPSLDRIRGTRTERSERSADVPQAGVLFRLDRRVSLFAGYSESFLGNPTMLRVNSVPTSPAEPSVGRGWEAGVRLELAEGRVSGTLSTYRIEASPTGIIVVTSGIDPDGTTLFTDIQGGRQESRGFECEFLVAPTDNLEIHAAYGTSDAVYARHPGNSQLDGSPLVAAPRRTASLWARHTFARLGRAKLTLLAGVNHVGETAFVPNNPAAVFPRHTTVDLGLGWRFRGVERTWSVDMLVKNVWDERYYLSRTSWGPPRHAMLTLRTRF